MSWQSAVISRPFIVHTDRLLFYIMVVVFGGLLSLGGWLGPCTRVCNYLSDPYGPYRIPITPVDPRGALSGAQTLSCRV